MKKILVVDDDQPILDLVTDLLEDAGYEVATSVDGGTLGKALKFQPALVLLDLMMPEMNGIEVSKALKTNPITKHIPIVLMSAGSNEHLARNSGAQIDGFIAKPFDINHLLKLIAKYSI